MKGIKWTNEGESHDCTLVSPFTKTKSVLWQSWSITMKEVGRTALQRGWWGWREWAAPTVTSHYSTKQVLSTPIFQLQQQNTNDRSFGYSSLGVHMANMMMSVTDRIKVTFTDGGWQHRFCSLNPSSSLFPQWSKSVQRQLSSQLPAVYSILSAAIPL